MTAIHRIDPEIWINTPLGEGHAIFLIDYGPMVNSVWVVHLLDTGRVVHVDSCEVRVMGNPMWGIPHPPPFGRVCEQYGRPEPRTTTRKRGEK